MSLVGVICDRCGGGYRIPAALWPGKGLCFYCDLSIPVWERNRYVRDQADAA